MKITEEKHNHKLTNLLKVFIFSVLMLLPFLNVAVRCAYVTFNKNAYQSYYGETINETSYKQTETFNDLQHGKSYLWNNQPITPQRSSGNFVLYVSNWESELLTFSRTPTILRFYSYPTDTDEPTHMYLIFNDEDGYIGERNLIDSILTFTFTLQSFTYNQNNYEIYLPSLYLIEHNDYSYLDNVFEYSLNKLEEEQYLTWTQNTAVYQGVNAMTTGLGITQAVIPMLIVYWFMLTIIYIIIDIVLALFTKLTHMIGNKTT